MADENISDLIEHYLKEILADNEQVKIRRSEIAGLFDVVPSKLTTLSILVLRSKMVISWKVNVVVAATLE